jgi:excisionase family DNA binding protein
MSLEDSSKGTGIGHAVYMPITDAAAYLGVSRSTVYRLMGSKRLPVYRLTPDAPRLKVSDLDAYAEGTREVGGQ